MNERTHNVAANAIFCEAKIKQSASKSKFIFAEPIRNSYDDPCTAYSISRTVESIKLLDVVDAYAAE